MTRGVIASLLSSALLGGVVPLLSTSPARAQTTYTLGIDVSHHQEDPPKQQIDWNTVAESGHVFAFHKATEGATFTDNMYATNRSEAAAAGIAFGAYHFARPQGDTIAAAQADAASEASHFFNVARPEPGDLVPVLDMEATGGLGPARLIAWTQAWLDAVFSSLGVRPLIYTSPNFWQSNLNDTRTFAEQGFPLWIAHYTSDPAPRVPASDWNGEGWSFWQWTSCATIPGISGCVDENRFPGSDLSPFTIPGEMPPEPTPEPATAPSNESPPTISGETEVGQTLTASTGTWTGTHPQSYSYEWFRCEVDGQACEGILNGTEPSYKLVAGDFGHRMKVTVTATNSAGSSWSESSLTDVVTDTTSPVRPQLTMPRAQVTLASSIDVAWTEPETGLSYDVRYRRAPKGNGFGGLVELLDDTSQSSTSLDATTGNTYCFSVRATDQAGNSSQWSAEGCTNVPLDDRDLRAGPGWSRRAAAAFYLGTFTKTRRTEAILTVRDVRVRDIHVVAQRCSGCGRVAVVFNGKRVATIRLGATRTRNQQVIRAVGFGSIRHGTVRLVVLSRNAPVKIDGLALSITN